MKNYIDNYNGKNWKEWHKHAGEIPIGDLDYWFYAPKFADERLMWHEMTKNHLKRWQRKVRRIFFAKFGEHIDRYTDLRLGDLELISFYYIPPIDFINTMNIALENHWTGTLADFVSKRKW